MKNFYTLAIFLIAFSINAQENIKYQKPSKEILDLVEFERPPSVQYDDDKNYMVFLYRDNYKSISKPIFLACANVDQCPTLKF